MVTAIGCDSEGWRHVLSVGAVDTESYDSWSASLGRVRERGVRGARLVTSDAHEGLRRAVEETFQGGRPAEMRRAPHARPREGRVGLQAHVAARLQDHGARLLSQGARAARGLPPGDRDVEGVLPGGGRAQRAGLPRLPTEPLEATAHQQPAGAHQQRDKAQVARGAGVPVGGVAGVPGERRHVRPGRGMVAVEVLLGGSHIRAPRRAGRGQAAAPIGEQLVAFRLVTRRVIEGSLELADELEAA